MTQTVSKAAGTPKSANITQRVGVGGTALSGGYVVDNEKSADLKGDKKYTSYSDILTNVAIISAGVRYYLNLVAKCGWTVVPADSSEEAAQHAAFVQSTMYDMETSWVRVVRRAAMYRFYGFSVQEWTAKKREDGQIGFLDIESRPQVTISKWDRDENGTITGMYQVSPQTQQEIYLPRFKVIYIVDDSISDSPEGLGMFRHLYPHARKLMRYEKLEGFGFETDLRGIPIGRAPKALLSQLVSESKITQAESDAAVKVLENFIESHIRAPETGLVLDSLTYQSQDDKGTPSNVKQWDLELLKGEPAALREIAEAINRLTHDIARIMGVDHLLLGSDSRGSHALAVDKTNSFYLIVDSTLTELTYAFEKNYIDTLWKLNGFDPKLKPSLGTESIKFRDIEQVAAALRDLATAGAPLEIDDPAVNEIRTLLGLSPTHSRVSTDGIVVRNGKPSSKEKTTTLGAADGTDSGDE